MPTTRHVFVDPDAGGTANGTSWTNAYTSLNTAEQTEDNTGDLQTRDEVIIFHCRASSGSEDAAQVAINGWTTTATNYIEMHCGVDACRSGAGDECVAANRHGGVWTTAKYRVIAVVACYIYEDYVRLHGIQFGSATGTGSAQHTVAEVTANAANALWVSDCIMKGHGDASYSQTGLVIQDGDRVTAVWNCVIYNVSQNAGSRGLSNGGGTLSCYSCTILGGAFAVRQNVSGGTLVAKNVYAGNSATEDYSMAAGGTLTKVNCASEDSSATDNPGSGETATNCVASVAYSTSSGAYFTNVTAGSEDFRISSASSALVNAGTDTSGESAPLNFTTDIAGQTRA